MRPEVTTNHTDHDVLCTSPIVVSFETKRSRADLEKATVQIGNMALVAVAGWSFVTSAIKDGKAVLYRDVELGKTSTGFGIMTTPVAPQHLARWAENSYWPIFKSEILDT
ncbi:hypothetical protein RB213_001174 [Colletotrichum asianum]